MLNVSDSNICKGDIISITCSAVGQPAVHSYQLFENDTPVPDSGTAGVWNRTMSVQGSFTYRCVANNTVGTSDRNVTVTVNGNWYLFFLLSNDLYTYKELIAGLFSSRLSLHVHAASGKNYLCTEGNKSSIHFRQK